MVSLRPIPDIEVRRLVGQGKTQAEVVAMIEKEIGLVYEDALAKFLLASSLVPSDIDDVVE